MVTMIEMEVMMTLKPRTEPFLALDAKGGVIEGKVKFVGFRGKAQKRSKERCFFEECMSLLYFISLCRFTSPYIMSCRTLSIPLDLNIVCCVVIT